MSAEGALKRETLCEPESYSTEMVKGTRKVYSDSEKAKDAHRLQSSIGSLIWFSCRSCPDLAYGVSLAASLITKNIDECSARTRRAVQYLATHISAGIFYRFGEKGEHVDIYGDASFAPGGAASTTGWILCLGSHAISWGSQRQSLISLSTCAVELIAATTAAVAAQPLLLLLAEIQQYVEMMAMRQCGSNCDSKKGHITPKPSLVHKGGILEEPAAEHQNRLH